jgi:group I intron endonuclease
MGNSQPSSKPILGMGFIYMITFPSGKSYIGQTKRNVLKRFNEHLKCNGSCTILENAIKKYGQENVHVETLIEINDSLLDFYEIKFIDLYGTIEPLGYNIRNGGLVGKHSKESCERMRIKKLAANNPNYGKERSAKDKLAISKSKIGEKHHFYGKKLTLDHKLNLSKSHKKFDQTLPMYISYCAERPAVYQYAGYAVTNHPVLRNKYFTSKFLTMEEKLIKAQEYLKSA